MIMKMLYGVDDELSSEGTQRLPPMFGRQHYGIIRSFFDRSLINGPTRLELGLPSNPAEDPEDSDTSSVVVQGVDASDDSSIDG